MLFKENDIKIEIENSLQFILEQGGERTASKIRPILYANLDRGRIHNFIGGDIQLVRDYVRRVADEYEKLSPVIYKLQMERSTETWEPLYKQMVSWSYSFFIKKGFTAGTNTQEIAVGCAADAAMNIIHAHFPYDADLDPWVCVIVQNACRRYIRGATKKSNIPDQNIIDLDETLMNFKDHAHYDQGYLEDLQSDLSEALAKLSEARRQVIDYIYFQELSPVEIASKMNKTVGAIYSLQFYALQDLQKILRRNRNNINE
jgi:RNA polymerase sigma factor (sigma-70 family)